MRSTRVGEGCSGLGFGYSSRRPLLRMVEHALAVAREVAAMTVCKATNANRLVEPEDHAGVGVESVAHDNRAVVGDRNEPSIEGGV